MNILNKLTVKHLTMNKKRTIVSIIGIILSTALMVGIGLLLSTFREVMIDDAKQYNGDYHAIIDKVDNYKLSLIENNTNVERFITRSYIGYSKITNLPEDAEDIISGYYKLYSIDDKYADTLTILTGKMPSNDSEIIVPSYLNTRYGFDFKVGDKITLNLGDRYVGDTLVENLNYVNDGEEIKVTSTKEYTITGIIEKDIYEKYESGYYLYTVGDNSETNEVFINYKNPSDTYKITGTIASYLGFTPLDIDGELFKEVTYNDNLLSLYGVSQYENLIGSISGMLIILLTLVSVACIVVIYNSFAISVMERKKQFGLFSSIGATKKQIRKTVLFEATVVSLIGIPIGILSAYIGIGVVVMLMNNLIGDAMVVNLHLSTYPTFLIIPIIFMILVVFISAFIPAKRASKISPIEAIRLNDDIKIKGKKITSPKWIKKVFGVEGDLAYKNMKRNKKKYRITVASLFISIVLFVSFSGFMTYLLTGTDEFIALPKFDLMLVYDDSTDLQLMEQIKNDDSVEESVSFKQISYTDENNLESMYTDRMKEKVKKFEESTGIKYINNIELLVLDDNTYDKYLKNSGEKDAKPIIYNEYSGIEYTSNSRKSYSFGKYKEDIKLPIKLTEYIHDDEEYLKDPENYKPLKKEIIISDYYYSSKTFMGLETMPADSMIVIMNNDLAKEYKVDSSSTDTHLLLNAPDYKKLDKEIDTMIKTGELSLTYYTNLTESTKLLHNLILIIKILVYGFITLVTLIGVTSVFNTINTSMALRRKEFAVLRSIGLTPKGFNKTLFFESLFFGLKSLLYGLPAAFGTILAMSFVMADIVEFDYILIPWNSVLLSIVGVFVVITISMLYATKKMKNENILDAIREENI